MKTKKILICGAGIAGLSLTRQLKKFDIDFTIIEKRQHLTAEGAGIALPANAMQGLRYIGLGDKIDRNSHQVTDILYTDAQGQILNQASLLQPPLNTDKFVALHRHQFHKILSEELETYIQLNTQIKTVTSNHSKVKVSFTNGKSDEFDLIVGADGVNSQIRNLFFGNDLLIDLGVTIWRWVCRYSTHKLQPTYMLSREGLFLAYPIGKNEVYCYAQVTDPDNKAANAFDQRENIFHNFKNFGGIAAEMLQVLPDGTSIIPGRLRSVSSPVFHTGRVVLIGDAAHACSPMLQQGAACAIEDVIVLSELLRQFSIEDAASLYQQNRAERIQWITYASDGPMKKLIHMNEEIFNLIQQNIRQNGPLNIQGWKKLFETQPLETLPNIIKA